MHGFTNLRARMYVHYIYAGIHVYNIKYTYSPRSDIVMMFFAINITTRYREWFSNVGVPHGTPQQWAQKVLLTRKKKNGKRQGRFVAKIRQCKHVLYIIM